MNLYHVECPQLGCMDIFANDRDEATELFNFYLAFNSAGNITYRVSESLDPMQLNRKERSMLLEAANRNIYGFGISTEDGWLIMPVWEYPFPRR